jgi:glycosyltransferase involved in cell wall biosynthesis
MTRFWKTLQLQSIILFKTIYYFKGLFILMHNPCPESFPAPPAGKTGWPWTQDSRPITARAVSDKTWPRVTMVTPSFNQGRFIEETIRSVLLQDYPDLEYIIVDGGSTDDTLRIIKQYEKWITGWVSEPDHGQSDAINKGWKKSTGEILAWLNSDDLLTPGAVMRAVKAFNAQPDCAVVQGDLIIINTDSQQLKYAQGVPFDFNSVTATARMDVYQPGSFKRRSVLEQVGWLDPNLKFAMDLDLWLRIGARYRFAYVPAAQAKFRMHDSSKTTTLKKIQHQEDVKIFKKMYRANKAVVSRMVVRKAMALLYFRSSLVLYRTNWLMAFRYTIKGLALNPFALRLYLLRTALTTLVPGRLKHYLRRK